MSAYLVRTTVGLLGRRIPWAHRRRCFISEWKDCHVYSYTTGIQIFQLSSLGGVGWKRLQITVLLGPHAVVSLEINELAGVTTMMISVHKGLCEELLTAFQFDQNILFILWFLFTSDLSSISCYINKFAVTVRYGLSLIERLKEFFFFLFFLVLF